MTAPNDHDAADPLSLVNYLDATMEAVCTPPCPSCNIRVEVVPASGSRFVLGVTHEPECSEVDA